MGDPRKSTSTPDVALLRLFDAALNRALEGLRVAEDVVRFGWDDRYLLEQLKQVRHRVASAAAHIREADFIRCRDTPADVGTDVRTDGERERPNLDAVLQANLRRAQEALRTLAESAKALDHHMAEAFEQARYDLYTLAKSILIMIDSCDRLAAVRLYVLVNAGRGETSFEDSIRMLVHEKVGAIQLRDKRLADRELIARGEILRRLTAGTSTLFIMNDRADLAAITSADGVHVGQDELRVGDARQIVGPRRLVGVSTHSLDQARQAVLDGADYLGVGPVFPTSTKSFSEFPGLDLVQQVAVDVGLPAFAIGGIDAGNLPQVITSGLSRVAVQSCVWQAEDPREAVRQLQDMLSAAAARR